MTEIARALADKRLLGAGLGSLESWQTWLIALNAAFALPLTEQERAIFCAIAGDRGLPSQRVRELWCVAALWLLRSSTRSRFGVTRALRRPIRRSTPQCCRAWRPLMAC